MSKVAFLGTGIMGAHMCRNLVQAGHTVVAWNRTKAKADLLLSDGVKVVADAKTAATGCDYLVLMLSDGPTCDLVLADGVYDALESGNALVVMSSIDLASVRRQLQECRKRDLRYIDAPVSGGEKGAREGNLSIMAGGSNDDFENVQEVLTSMGSPVLIGPAGTGQLTKLTNQIIVALTITAVAESMIFAETGGADLRAVREALMGGFADSTIMQHHALRMINRDFDPGGPSKHQLKDLRGALAAAGEMGLAMPQLRWAEKVYAEFVMGGGADLDHSGIIEHLRATKEEL